MTLTEAQQAQQCPTCGTTGRRGYCAPLRCVCGHEDCPAFASWEPRPQEEPLPDNVRHLSSRRTGLALIEED